VVSLKYTSTLAVTTAMTPRTEAVTKRITKEGGATVIIAGVAVKIPPRGEVGRRMRSTASAVSSRVSAKKNVIKNFLDWRNGFLDFVQCGQGVSEDAVLQRNRV
jgi:hypothetical protein